MKFLNRIVARKTNRAQRRKGVAFLFVALGMVTLLGVTGLVVDIGHLHMKEAQAMRAADAAALAGAMQLPDEDKALAKAREFAKSNKYDLAQAGTVVNGNVDPDDKSRYTVFVSRPEPLFFISVLNVVSPGFGTQRVVGASATAQYDTPQDLPADLSIGTGDGVGPINLAVFGPQAYYSFGDAYSPQQLDDGSVNPRHTDFDGYNFRLTIPTDYVAKNGTSIVNVQIFDADGQNLDGNDSPDGVTRIDEIMPSPPEPHAQPRNKYTTTRYRLYKINPADPTKDILIATQEYGASTAETDMKWVTPDGFTLNLNDYGPGEFRINVLSIDGSSENGFNLRAVTPQGAGTVGSAGGVNADNGTNISAIGRLPINFNNDGLTTLSLGTVPTAAAGNTLTIDKFDTDVGARDIYFVSDPPASNQPPGGFPGRLANNGEWLADQIQLPDDYTTSTWSVRYQAGQQDTTVWELSYASPNSQPGKVKLVGRDGRSY